jgi:putative endonuclease
MVEQVPVKDKVRGSSPLGGARHKSAPGFARRQKQIWDADGCRIAPVQPSMKFYYVYALRNPSKDFIYIGYSEDLKQRFISHNKGENKSTKAYVPLKLIHYEAYKNIKDAKRRELYLKSSKGKTTLKTMLREYFKE